MSHPLCLAIAQREVIRFTYDGGMRTVEPHAHGYSKAGHAVLRGYQLEGASSSGVPVGWKLFAIGRMGPATGTGTRFATPRAGYARWDREMTTVCCQV